VNWLGWHLMALLLSAALRCRETRCPSRLCVSNSTPSQKTWNEDGSIVFGDHFDIDQRDRRVFWPPFQNRRPSATRSDKAMEADWCRPRQVLNRRQTFLLPWPMERLLRQLITRSLRRREVCCLLTCRKRIERVAGLFGAIAAEVLGLRLFVQIGPRARYVRPSRFRAVRCEAARRMKFFGQRGWDRSKSRLSHSIRSE